MKKITKLSLVAILGLAGSLSANTLAEAFAASKVKGEIKAQYFDVQSALNNTNPLVPVPGDGSNDTIGVLGGNLNLITGSFNGLKAGVTFQTSHVLSLDTNQNNDFAGTMDASGSVMSEAYLSYTLANTTAKIGRQYITTPLVAGSGSRMIKQSFEGITVVNTDIPKTTLLAAYTDKFQGRTDNAGSPGEFNQYQDGVYTLYVKNNSIENVTINAQYADIKGSTNASDGDLSYLDAVYSANGLTLAAQYLNGDDNSTNSGGTLFGAKVSGNIGMVNLSGLYSKTNDKNVFKGGAGAGVGSGADASFTALPVHGGGVTYVAETDTMVAVAATNVAGATLVAYYGVVNTDLSVGAGYEKIKAVGGFVQYAFNKEFSVKVMYESADFDTLPEDDNHFRVYTSYKF